MLQLPNWAHCFHPSFLQHTQAYFSNKITSCHASPSTLPMASPTCLSTNPVPFHDLRGLLMRSHPPLSLPSSATLQPRWPSFCSLVFAFTAPLTYTLCSSIFSWQIPRAMLKHFTSIGPFLPPNLNSVFPVSSPHSLSHHSIFLIAPTSICNNLILLFTCLYLLPSTRSKYH